jgi:hypothetical protein
VAGNDIHSVWYSWTAPSDADVTFRVFLRSMADSTLGVFQGDAVDQLTLVASNDDTYDYASEVTFTPVTGQTYMIRIAAYDPQFGDDGTFALQWGGGCPAPGNDDFADATTISGPAGYLSAETSEAATSESGELDTHSICIDNDCATHSDLGGTSVWYSWTAPFNIQDFDVCVPFRSDGADLNPAVAVYTGSLGSLTEVAFATAPSFQGGACTAFDAQSGTTYVIGVGGEYGSTGAFDLVWGDVSIPTCTGTTVVTCTFSTVGTGTFTVPVGTTQVTIEAKGAKGGPGNFGVDGGKGAQVQASFPVTAGEVLNVLVGGMGSTVQTGGGGGGGSFVYRTASASGLLIAAAGGGGARAEHAGLDGSATTTAGDGESGGGIGGAAGRGGNGGGGGTGIAAAAAGGGGLFSDGGNGTGASPAIGGQALLNGAAGGAGESDDTGGGHGGFGGGGGAATFGGGGGGGYNGGGGGAGGSGAGGGGGSFCARSATNTSGTSGANSGDGQVTITYSAWGHTATTPHIAPGWHRPRRGC